MTDTDRIKSMSTDEIIKSYEWCIGDTYGKCTECSFADIAFCDEKLQDTVIETFKRQKAEIERLTINMNAFGLGMKREKERADNAIKEFAERLKSRLITVTYMNFDDTIDNLVKEMAGDTE